MVTSMFSPLHSRLSRGHSPPHAENVKSAAMKWMTKAMALSHHSSCARVSTKQQQVSWRCMVAVAGGSPRRSDSAAWSAGVQLESAFHDHVACGWPSESVGCGAANSELRLAGSLAA